MGGACSICFSQDKQANHSASDKYIYLPPQNDSQADGNDPSSIVEGDGKVSNLYPLQPRMTPRHSLAPTISTSPAYTPPPGLIPVPSSPSERSKLIDKLLANEKSSRTAEVKILLLGAGESGKSTIVKQMKIIHEGGFSSEELWRFRSAIFSNVLDASKQVLKICDQLGYTEKLREESVQYIRALEIPNFEELSLLPPNLVQAINYLWLESGIRNSFANICHASYVLDSAPYFFEEINRIGMPEYVPNTMDVLKARARSTGVSEYRFRVGTLAINMFDLGGQRPERKSWVQSFEGVMTIIFCVALSEYDQFLLEQPEQNRLLESFQLFSDIVRSRWFINSSIVLFLNKKDIFQEKLKKVPLQNYFPDYEGGANLQKAAEYIKSKFYALNHNQLPLYSYLTQATDTTNINMVFAAVRESVLTQALKQSGLF